MDTDDRFENKIDEAAGKAKEKTGEVTNNPDLEREGKADQAKSNLKQAMEKVKDVFRK